MLKTRYPMRGCVVALMTVVLLCVAIENSASQQWKPLGELPTRRREFSIATVDEKIYLIGGNHFENENGPFGISRVDIYDPRRNTWSRGADMPTPRAGSKAAVADGKIYVFGGYTGGNNRPVESLKVVEMYDPDTDTWVRKQDMSVPRRQFGIGGVVEKIYLIGGVLFFGDREPGAPARLDLVEMYDPATDTWTKRAKMPTRRDGVQTAILNDRIYVIGGAGWPMGFRGGPRLATIEVYHPKTNQWKKKRDMPTLKIGFSTVVIAGKIYLIGGHGGVAFEEYLTTVDIYDPGTERWGESPPMPIGNTPSGAAAINGAIYIFGSERENSELSSAVEVFDTGFRGVEAKGKLATRWGQLKARP